MQGTHNSLTKDNNNSELNVVKEDKCYQESQTRKISHQSEDKHPVSLSQDEEIKTCNCSHFP